MKRQSGAHSISRESFIATLTVFMLFLVGTLIASTASYLAFVLIEGFGFVAMALCVTLGAVALYGAMACCVYAKDLVAGFRAWNFYTSKVTINGYCSD